jgi:biopolymer transport protein ExbD
VNTFDATESGAEALSRALARAIERTSEASVYVRADRRESYERVHPALEAVRAAGVGDVRLIIRPERKTDGGES